MMKPLLAFDLDGTLIDSARDITNAVNITLLRHGKSTVPYDTVVAHIGEGLRKLLIDFFPEYLNLPDILDKIELEFLHCYEEEMLKETKVYPGVIDFLTHWHGPIGIITNKPIIPTKILVEHLGLKRFPWIEIYGADSLAEKKPSPLPLHTMMRLAGRPSQHTIMIGDGIPDMQSAINAGVRSIAINFGYTSKNILQKYSPSALLEHYSELPKVLQTLGY
jgi:phosphoglycolate phosphatase